ncbi:hypothetical protein PFLUV_G00137160 [Perca fluviatilis]|uniref:Uncharacterized protein n=1 Tax=Perca fluviatilis TaxID=8168 RepID=A0A6A5E5G7_PERFL|nr:hypothetical protein PFLUV_G00137160 [Perca fluviatilis]
MCNKNGLRQCFSTSRLLGSRPGTQLQLRSVLYRQHTKNSELAQNSPGESGAECLTPGCDEKFEEASILSEFCCQPNLVDSAKPVLRKVIQISADCFFSWHNYMHWRRT